MLRVGMGKGVGLRSEGGDGSGGILTGMFSVVVRVAPAEHGRGDWL